ncbi:hypothetical protein BDV06DRAFT_134236 [Aspergillus oleicola]
MDRIVLEAVFKAVQHPFELQAKFTRYPGSPDSVILTVISCGILWLLWSTDWLTPARYRPSAHSIEFCSGAVRCTDTIYAKPAQKTVIYLHWTCSQSLGLELRMM